MNRHKHLYHSLMGLVIFAAVLVLSGMWALAANQGKMTLTLVDGEVTMQLYQIGGLRFEQDQWYCDVNSEYAEAGFELASLNHPASQLVVMAKELQAYTQKHEIGSYREGTSDGQGLIVYDNLPQGVYLAVKSEATAADILIDPFIITMPLRDKETGDYKYEFTCEPKGEVKTEERNLRIQKVSADSGQALSGAKFELSYRETDGDDNIWSVYQNELVTAGADGSITTELPEYYWGYEYRLIEIKAPSGYSSSKVGTITFTIGEDGRIVLWSHTGTAGYVDVPEGDMIIIVKNDKTKDGNDDSQSSDGPDSTDHPSDLPTIQAIDPGETPLANITDTITSFLNLARTGDYGIPIAVLISIMILAGGGVALLTHSRRKRK